ncbi:hypothetical protein TEA_009394 [Camellia sinensis var. sinensis]|uniref:Uncharacterized protein n=1 Tax=Camellia sinensis var. sinensis TaxID=542762 RepID=A0A4S4D192_CAMSN|nr:hypothetical protein TEA_009394 [Camellia sinensis var. sinensis]
MTMEQIFKGTKEFKKEIFDKDGRINVLYSTPSLYTDAKNAENVSWPLKTDDYYPNFDPLTLEVWLTYVLHWGYGFGILPLRAMHSRCYELSFVRWTNGVAYCLARRGVSLSEAKMKGEIGSKQREGLTTQNAAKIDAETKIIATKR